MEETAGPTRRGSWNSSRPVRPRIEADTRAARAGWSPWREPPAALRAEAEGKARGQSEAQEKAAALGEAIAELNMRLGRPGGGSPGRRKSMTELEELRRDLTGDKAEREKMLSPVPGEEPPIWSGRSRRRSGQLQTIRQENQDRQAAISRINDEKLALEAQRNQADKDARDKNSALLNLEREVSVLEQKKAAAAMEEKTLLDKLWRPMSCPTRRPWPSGWSWRASPRPSAGWAS